MTISPIDYTMRNGKWVGKSSFGAFKRFCFDYLSYSCYYYGAEFMGDHGKLQQLCWDIATLYAIMSNETKFELYEDRMTTAQYLQGVPQWFRTRYVVCIKTARDFAVLLDVL